MNAARNELYGNAFDTIAYKNSTIPLIITVSKYASIIYYFTG